MKQFIMCLGLIYCLFFTTTPPIFAGSGASDTVLKDVHSFKVYYGSTESNSNYSLINYIDVQVSVPGLRGAGDVWASPTIIPDTSTSSYSPYISPTLQSFGWGIGSKTIRFRIYTPSNPNARIRVRRAKNKINVKFTYQYIGSMNSNNCANGMCGSVTATVVVL